MIVFTCAQARDFKALLARCSTGRPRGPAPPVVVRAAGRRRTIAATSLAGIGLTRTIDVDEGGDGIEVLPGAVLAEVEGGTDDPVRLEWSSKSRGVVRWQAQGRPRSLDMDRVVPSREHEIPRLPRLSAVSPEFLTALHECGRGVAREAGRYDLTKIQIQGNTGSVISTDSKLALLWSGFDLPFADQFLVPAVPVFGSKELTRAAEARVGRTVSHLVVAAGPWTISLPIDMTARFPDVASVIPRNTDATVVGIDERDAEALLTELPRLPGGNDENRPVTLHLEGGVTVRARDTSSGVIREVFLVRSPVAGPTLSVALDRTALARILSLGCHTLRVVNAKPVVAEGPNRTVIVAPLDSAAVIPPSENMNRIATDDSPVALAPHQPITPPRTTMKPPLPNGHGPQNRPEPTRDDQPDSVAAAEELRIALADAASKATRLVALLKSGRKEKKVLASVWAGLKQLNLGSTGDRP